MRRARITARLEAFALTVPCLIILTIFNSISAQAAPSKKRPAAQPKASNHKEEKEPAAQPKAPSHKEEKKPAAQPKTSNHKEEKKPAAQPKTSNHKEEKKPAAQPSIPIRVVSHNVTKDFVGKDLPPDSSALHEAVSQAEAMDAHILALQEVCPDQYEWLKTRHHWMTRATTGTRETKNGCNLPDGRHGMPVSVIAWRRNLGGEAKEEANLSGIPGEVPGDRMVCAKFTLKDVPVHACSVHLVSTDWASPDNVPHQGSAIRKKQIAQIRQITKEWIDKDHFVVVAGDFNANPWRDEMDKMYDSRIPGGGNPHGFTEYNRHPPPNNNRDGEYTADPPCQPLELNDGPDWDGPTCSNPANPNEILKDPPRKKIDYIFFSTNRAQLDGGDFDKKKTKSDHRMIWSTAQMSLKVLR